MGEGRGAKKMIGSTIEGVYAVCAVSCLVGWCALLLHWRGLEFFSFCRGVERWMRLSAVLASYSTWYGLGHCLLAVQGEVRGSSSNTSSQAAPCFSLALYQTMGLRIN